jgi:hypothetical protein
MMKHLLVVFAAMLVVLPELFAGEPVKGFETERIMLYQTNAVLSERVPNVGELADYIKRLQAVCAMFFSDATTPETLYIVVALKPAKQSRVWFVSSMPSPGDMKLEPLRLKLEAVAPIEVQHGPVAFAISAKIAGGSGDPSKEAGYHQPPIPREWQEAAKGHKEPVAVPDGFLDLVWPDKK